MKKEEQLKVGFAQMAPIWLQRQPTMDKMLAYVQQAGEQGCQLLTFGETLLPGYPFWLDFSDGARFNSSLQKEMHAHYLEQAVQIERGDLDAFCQAARAYKMALILGVVERPTDRGGIVFTARWSTLRRRGRLPMCIVSCSLLTKND